MLYNGDFYNYNFQASISTVGWLKLEICFKLADSLLIN